MDAIDRTGLRLDDRATLARRAGLTDSDPRVEVQVDRGLVDVSEALRRTGVKTMHHELDHHVTLTPQTPYVEGRGHLDVLMGRSYWGKGSRIDFLTSIATGNDGDPLPRVEIWLDGLDTETTYVAVIRVAGDATGGNARIRVRTSEGEPGEDTIEPFDADGQLVVAFLPAGRELDMALIAVEGIDTPSWSFYDVTVSKFG